MVIKTEPRKLVNTKSQFDYKGIDEILHKKGFDRWNNKRPSGSQWLKIIDNNPEIFKTSKTHIEKVNKIMNKADKELERNLKTGSSNDVKIKIDLGPDIYARAKSRLCKIIKVEDVVTVLFPNGNIHEYEKTEIKTYVNQEKAEKKFEEELSRKNINIEDLCLNEEEVDKSNNDPWDDW